MPNAAVAGVREITYRIEIIPLSHGYSCVRKLRANDGLHPEVFSEPEASGR